MRRRAFLGLLSALAAGAAALPAARQAIAQSDRLTWWDPASPASPPDLVVLEWRYLAGRITAPGEDFGFVVSLADYNPPLPLDPAQFPPQLLVMRQDLTGGAGHVAATYPSAFGYDVPSATYSYTASGGAASATWTLDDQAPSYELSVSSPELSLADLTLDPMGPLIAEAGTGEIVTGRFGNVEIRSDYHADWVAIRRGGEIVGYGRLDMQTLKPSGFPTSTDFSHHWFAAAASVAGEPVWISAWRLVSDVTSWAVTIARGSGASWRVESFTEQTAGLGFPLEVTILDYQAQPVPAGAPARRTGRRWRVSAGVAAPGDLIDLELAVAPGQFISGARVAGSIAGAIPMQEAVTAEVAGAVGGTPLEGARFAIAESTFSEPAPPAEEERLFLPLLHV